MIFPPSIILVRPQMGENIGAAARAMSNFGLTELRLVAPRDGWPNPKAYEVAAGGRAVLEAAQIFTSTAEALAGIHTAYATTARPRDMMKPVALCHEAIQSILLKARHGQRCAILFGPERTGLINDDVALCDSILTIPTATDNPSLNMAQAAVVAGYEWARASQLGMDENWDKKDRDQEIPATKEELQSFFDHLEPSLEAVEFFKSPDHKPVMWRNLRNYFVRSTPTSQDVRTLHGIIRALRLGKPRSN